MGCSAHLGIFLPLQAPSWFRFLHLTYECFLDLEKTSFEPHMVPCSCNPSTQDVEAERSGVQRGPELQETLGQNKTKNSSRGVHLGYWYVEDIPQSAKWEPFYIMNFEQRCYFRVMHQQNVNAEVLCLSDFLMRSDHHALVLVEWILLTY